MFIFNYIFVGKRHMQTYIAILRGINVSGSNKIKMNELISLLQGLKFENVKTYIQSGNIIFDHTKTPSRDLGMLIRAKIMEHYGYNVPTVVLTVKNLMDIMVNNPFINRKEDESKLHVTFLSEDPEQEHLEKALTISNPPDEWKIKGKAIYLFCPQGYGRTKFNNNFFEKKLKVTATTRNWRTCNKLLEMAANQ